MVCLPSGINPNGAAYVIVRSSVQKRTRRTMTARWRRQVPISLLLLYPGIRDQLLPEHQLLFQKGIELFRRA